MKYINDQVYNFHYDYCTGEIKKNKYNVISYEFLDGMQWEKMDVYYLEYEIKEQSFFGFKKTKRKMMKLPGALIDTDEYMARLKTDMVIINSYNYLNEYDALFSNIQRKILNNARKNIENATLYFPEKVLDICDLYIHPSFRNLVWR